MKTYFRDVKCPECGTYHEPTLNACPSCGHQDPQARDFHAFEHHVHDRFIWQVVFFLIGFAGLQIVGLIVGLIEQAAYIANHPGFTVEELKAFLSSGQANLIASGVTYVIIAAIYFLIFGIRRRYKELFASFKDPKKYLIGLIGGAAIIGVTMLYSLIANAIFVAAGVGEIGVNNNETVIRSMIAFAPALCIILFGIVGPFCEEIAYRVGLFGFFTRLGKPLGYVISALIFGMVHFNWSASSGQEWLVEFVNLPSYIGSGLALAFLYDRFGLSASLTAHIANNIASIVMTIVQGTAA